MNILDNSFVNLLTPVEAARLLKVKPQTLAVWRHYGKGPRYVRVGTRAVRYRAEDLLRFVDALEAQGPLPPAPTWEARQ